MKGLFTVKRGDNDQRSFSVTQSMYERDQAERNQYEHVFDALESRFAKNRADTIAAAEKEEE